MPSDYTLEVLDRPGFTLPPQEKSNLQDDLCRLGDLCFNPLPQYQVFDRTSQTALDDKIIILVRQGPDLIAFVSAVILPVSGLDNPVIHSGLTTIHPQHRKSGVIHKLFGTLFYHLFTLYPEGVWMSTLAKVITSLSHMAKYTTNVFPSPQWEGDHPGGKPSQTHVQIARQINDNHRDKLFVPHTARFDERAFVFRSSKNALHGPSYMKDANDPRYWHHERELTEFYRSLLQDEGDEVLQISFLDPGYVLEVASRPRFKNDWKKKFSKL